MTIVHGTRLVVKLATREIEDCGHIPCGNEADFKILLHEGGDEFSTFEVCELHIASLIIGLLK